MLALVAEGIEVATKLGDPAAAGGFISHRGWLAGLDGDWATTLRTAAAGVRQQLESNMSPWGGIHAGAAIAALAPRRLRVRGDAHGICRTSHHVAGRRLRRGDRLAAGRAHREIGRRPILGTAPACGATLDDIEAAAYLSDGPTNCSHSGNGMCDNYVFGHCKRSFRCW